MGLHLHEEDSVTAVGYTSSSIFDARSILESIADDIADDFDNVPPRGLYDSSRVFKVTITVELM
jgi:hypothetical protein